VPGAGTGEVCSEATGELAASVGTEEAGAEPGAVVSGMYGLLQTSVVADFTGADETGEDSFTEV